MPKFFIILAHVQAIPVEAASRELAEESLRDEVCVENFVNATQDLPVEISVTLQDPPPDIKVEPMFKLVVDDGEQPNFVEQS